MSVTVKTPPAETPISLEEAKSHLRVDSSADDTYITGLISAATDYVERLTNRALVSQTIEFTTTALNTEIVLPRAPATSLTSVSYVDSDGNTQTVNSGVYGLDTTATPSRIRLKHDQSLPSVSLETVNPVTVEYVAGYATASGVPEPLRAAVKMFVSHLYENREPMLIGTSVTEIPLTFKALLDPYVVQNPEDAS